MRNQAVTPTAITPADLKAGECLLLRYDVETDTHRACLVACVRLFDDADAFTALDTGLHVRIEVICGPDSWGQDAELIIVRSTGEVSIKATGAERVPVRTAGIASNRNVALRVTRQ